MDITDFSLAWLHADWLEDHPRYAILAAHSADYLAGDALPPDTHRKIVAEILGDSQAQITQHRDLLRSKGYDSDDPIAEACADLETARLIVARIKHATENTILAILNNDAPPMDIFEETIEQLAIAEYHPAIIEERNAEWDSLSADAAGS